ncbi:MAG: hypothetical protein JRJ29_01470 [Deltaproteobacteria bacterium]|nr:hypothetical protein [Deltaproteobacteria bacterium]
MKQQDEFDKIKVLLIDDNPTFLQVGDYVDPQTGRLYEKQHCPVIQDQREGPDSRSNLKDLFELRWIASSVEAREFRDLALAIRAHSPLDLGKLGWIPEIVCFDYAMTKITTRVEERLHQDIVPHFSPIIAMRELAESLNLSLSDLPDVPDTGAAHDADNQGCFSGGLIFTALSDHPCAPLAITRKGKEKTRGTEAAFFEWMLEHESYGTFMTKGRPAPDWNSMLFEAVSSLRKRIWQLAASNVIQISLDDLLKLASDQEQRTLTITSRYGRRCFPIDGLFIDIAEPDRSAEAGQWAREILESALGHWGKGEAKPAPYQESIKEIIDALAVSDELWNAWSSDKLLEHFELSRLIAKAQKTKKEGEELESEDKAALKKLCDLYGVKEEDIYSGRPECSKGYVDIRYFDCSDKIKRWAITFSMIKLLAMRQKAVDNSRASIFRGKSNQEVMRLVAIKEHDVYLLIFPLAKNRLPLPWHNEDKNALGTWTNYLKRLGTGKSQKKSDWGDLGVSVPDVLAGKDWVSSSPQSDHGLLPTERQILKWYALSIGFEPNDWENDEKSRNVLVGAKFQSEGA